MFVYVYVYPILLLDILPTAHWYEYLYMLIQVEEIWTLTGLRGLMFGLGLSPSN